MCCLLPKLGIGQVRVPTNSRSLETLSRKVNKGVGIEMVHFLGDDLWTLARID